MQDRIEELESALEEAGREASEHRDRIEELEGVIDRVRDLVG